MFLLLSGFTVLSLAACHPLAALPAMGNAPWLVQESPPVRARPLRPDPAVSVGWEASGAGGAISCGGAEAAAAGAAVLRSGGNAADAAAATILALSVTDAHLFCFGGEVPILVYDAQRGRVEVIAGQGVAPRLATREHFAGRAALPTAGLDVAAVPAAPDAVLVLLERHGTRRFADVAAPALALLDRGQEPWHPDLARTIRRMIAAEATTTDRELGLRRAADLFYRGAIARELDAWSRANGGLLRFEDLATHVTRIEEPVVAPYKGYSIVKCGPWTQGPSLIQALQILDGHPAMAGGPRTAEGLHTTVEAMKLALADRDIYYADPLFADVPLSALLDPGYAAMRRPLIDSEHASLELRPGDPVGAKPLLTTPPPTEAPPARPHDTTTCLVADRAGNVVAATPSGWSGVLAGGTGVWLGSRLQSFRIEADHPNALEPGKRPRITLTPTLVLKDGKPVLAVSVAGGDLQDQTCLQMVLNRIDAGMTAAEAVTAPRWGTEHHVGSFGQAPPKLGSLTLNGEWNDEVIEAMRQKGHRVEVSRGAIAAPSVLVIDPTSGRIDAAGDPKAGRHAAAID